MLHDVAIVGAGPVGATLALVLADGDLDVVVLDARPAGESLRGDRSLALSHGARLILERIGVWAPLAAVAGAATPIVEIDVSQAGGFGAATLAAADEGLPALGYVVSYRVLQRALDDALARRGLPVRHGVSVSGVTATPACARVDGADTTALPLLARLAAIADGSGAAVEGLVRHRHDYRQVALVARVWRANPHRGRAYERFTPQGPVALLPEGDHDSLVWTATPERAQALLEASDAAFLATLAAHFGTRTGGFTRVADRRSFPLALEFARQPSALRCVALGNAAQTLHPVAGQGFNVGLRDAYELGQVILDTPRDALGDRPMLERYVRGRRADRFGGVAFTHGLVTIFGNDVPLARWPRGLALTLLDVLPPARRLFTRAMLFGLH
ncbi:MAG: FAD-dependent monooxygenase [Betaproteobacteria bacterium]|nr:FAD-dependent monooxygenase [Betaproteobacteria bacterium]